MYPPGVHFLILVSLDLGGYTLGIDVGWWGCVAYGSNIVNDSNAGAGVHFQQFVKNGGGGQGYTFG